MLSRHGSPLVVLGAMLAIAAGAFAFYFSGSLVMALGASATVLALFAVVANRPAQNEAARTPLLSLPSAFARSALFYTTAGALIEVWSGVWFWYLWEHPPRTGAPWYWCYGFLFTGLLLLVIGMLVGNIGRKAREAELPPPQPAPLVRHS